MNRRTLIKSLGLLVAGIAVEQAIPKNRVWSFPKNIKITPACPGQVIPIVMGGRYFYVRNSPDKMVQLKRTNSHMAMLSLVPGATFLWKNCPADIQIIGPGAASVETMMLA